MAQRGRKLKQVKNALAREVFIAHQRAGRPRQDSLWQVSENEDGAEMTFDGWIKVVPDDV